MIFLHCHWNHRTEKTKKVGRKMSSNFLTFVPGHHNPQIVTDQFANRIPAIGTKNPSISKKNLLPKTIQPRPTYPTWNTSKRNEWHLNWTPDFLVRFFGGSRMDKHNETLCMVRVSVYGHKKMHSMLIVSFVVLDSHVWAKLHFLGTVKQTHWDNRPG